MPSLHTSRNFIIHSLPYIVSIEAPKDDLFIAAVEASPRQQHLLRILAASNSFMSGSLVPEIVQNFTIVIQDFALLRILSSFSSTLQFTNQLSLRKMLHHEIHPYFERDENTNQLSLVRSSAMITFLPAQFLTNLITSTRYFTRQLTSFDFYSVNDCYREIFRDCLPHLRALRHLKIKFPIRHDICVERYRNEESDLYPYEYRYGLTTDEEDFEKEDCDQEEEEEDAGGVVEHWCTRGADVIHCISHGRRYTMLKQHEIVSGLKNLRNLDSLELVSSRELRNSTLAEIWEKNPMPHLKRLSLTFSPFSIGDPIDWYCDPYEENNMHASVRLRSISQFHPRLTSLTLFRTPGAVLNYRRSSDVDFMKMSSLQELTLFGFIKPNGYRSFINGCCPSLTKLSLGGFGLKHSSGRLSASDLDDILRSFAGEALDSLDLMMSPFSNHDAGQLDNIVDNTAISSLVQTIKLLQHFRLYLSNNMSNDTFKSIGEHSGLLRTLHLKSDSLLNHHQRRLHFDDEGLSFLFDPEKCLSCCYATLEELAINSEVFTGRDWFGPDEMIPQKSCFSLRKLDLSDMPNLAVRDGFIEILYAFSDCLEELYLPCSWSRLRSAASKELEEHQPEENERTTTKMTKLRVVHVMQYVSKTIESMSDVARPSIFYVLSRVRAIILKFLKARLEDERRWSME